MNDRGRWVYQEEQVPYAFSLSRVLDAGTSEQSYDLLGVVRVSVDRRQPEKLSSALRPWALATLANGGYGFGRFYVSYSTLDEDGEPYQNVADEYIDWSGSEALTPDPEGSKSARTGRSVT